MFILVNYHLLNQLINYCCEHLIIRYLNSTHLKRYLLVHIKFFRFYFDRFSFYLKFKSNFVKLFKFVHYLILSPKFYIPFPLIWLSLFIFKISLI